MSLASTHKYETVYILKSSLSDSDATAIHQKLDNVVGKFSGAVQHRDDWGLRELAYTIDNETTGRYNIMVFSGQGGVVEEIERHFRILENVIRFITVMVPADYDYTKIKKQMVTIEEDVKKNREARKKGM